MFNVGAANTLADILSLRRPHRSQTESDFVRDFIDPTGVRADEIGNRILRIGSAPILWSAHTDTIHRHGGTQAIRRDGDSILLAKKSKSDCLGADDGAGIWLMLEMIAAGVEGLYVFHRGEECNGIGSSFIVHETPELLDGIQAAIALDRKGYNSVVTHQYGRCCSDSFALSLAAGLGFHYVPDATGLFTDTANYTELVPECTNISVGYHHAHSSAESLDFGFLVALRDSLLRLDLSALTIERDPSDPGEAEIVYSGHWPADYGASYGATLADMIAANPEIAADVFEQYGIDDSEFSRILKDYI